MLLIFRHFLHDDDQCGNHGGSDQHYILIDIPQIRIRLISNDDQNEAQHEAVTIVQPVRLLESVPDKVKRIDTETEHEEQNHASVCDFFTNAASVRGKEGGNKQQRQYAAIDEGPPGRTNGVIRAGQELIEQIQKIEPLLKLPTRIGKGIFSELQRIVGSKDDDAGNPDCQQRKCGNADKGLQRMIGLPVRIVVIVLLKAEYVEEKV